MQVEELLHILKYGDVNIVDKCVYLYNILDIAKVDRNEIISGLINYNMIFYFHPSILKSISLCMGMSSGRHSEEKIEFDNKRESINWLGGNKAYYVPRKEKLERIMNEI